MTRDHGRHAGRPEPRRRLLLAVLAADRQARVHRGKRHYTTGHSTVNVAAEQHRPGRLHAEGRPAHGHPGRRSARRSPGAARHSQTLTVKNTGSAPATVKLGEQPGGFTPLLTARRPAAARSRASTPPLSLHGASGTATAHGQAGRRRRRPTRRGTAIADYPTADPGQRGRRLRRQGLLGFGYTGSGRHQRPVRLRPGHRQPGPTLAARGRHPGGAGHGVHRRQVLRRRRLGRHRRPRRQAGDLRPGHQHLVDRRHRRRSRTRVRARAVLDGKLYVGRRLHRDRLRHHRRRRSTTRPPTAGRPRPPTRSRSSWESCGGIGGKLYCAGGTTDAGRHQARLRLRPGRRHWSPIAGPADRPVGLGLHRGQRPAAGLRRRQPTTAPHHQPGLRLRPGSRRLDRAAQRQRRRSTAAAAPAASTRSAAAPAGFAPPVTAAEVLPGYDRLRRRRRRHLAVARAPTTVTLQPARATTVTVTLDASVPEITQPGTYTAALDARAPTPRTRWRRSACRMTVNPPKTWGKITGTVDVRPPAARRIAGATVQIDTLGDALHPQDRRGRQLRAVARRPQQPAAASSSPRTATSRSRRR